MGAVVVLVQSRSDLMNQPDGPDALRDHLAHIDRRSGHVSRDSSPSLFAAVLAAPEWRRLLIGLRCGHLFDYAGISWLRVHFLLHSEL